MMTPVIRGGSLRDSAVLLEQVLDNEADGSPVLSVYWAEPLDGETESEYILRVCVESKVRHGKIQISTPAALAAAGFALERDESGGQEKHHHHVVFSSPVSESQAQAFVNVFSEPQLNPTGGYKVRS